MFLAARDATLVVLHSAQIGLAIYRQAVGVAVRRSSPGEGPGRVIRASRAA